MTYPKSRFKMDSFRYVLIVLACLIVMPSPAPAENVLDPDAWPKTFDVAGTEIAVYMPQILEWSGYRHLKGTAAIGIKFAGQEEATFGAVGLEADTIADFDRATVMVGRRVFKDFRFPELDAAQAAKAEELLRSVFTPDAPMEIPLATVTAALERADASVGEAAVSFDPPPIFHSDSPAVLVVFIGEPKLETVNADDPGTLFAVNTNWDVLFDGSEYYLLNGSQWLATKDLTKGPWTAATKIPDAFYKLPDDENWSEVKASLVVLPDAPAPPKVFVSDRPAEIIVTDGKPQLIPISGTALMYVSNTESDLFYHIGAKSFYLLTAGRWFASPSLNGPWGDASDSLPGDFADIPSAHPKSHVLVSVSGTAQADEAVILASIPQTATVDRATTTLSVAYEGEPEFRPVGGTEEVQFAINTSYDVLSTSGAFYCCYQGVWFEAAAATGPWVVCDKVPAPIYTIPAESPKYNVTYVHVYESTPTTVQVGYTSGYEGNYIARGLVVFGLGMWLGSELADNYWHGRYYPSPYWYGYGCGAVYRSGYGYYRSGARYYGPYGGAGYAARYNPATGVYSRGAYAYGPRGAAGVRTAYNPWTNTAAGRVGVSTPYGSWGRSAVVRDDDWARAGHRSNAYGTVGGIQTSQGGGAVGVNRKYGSDAFVGKTGDGDVYVGKDGNIYKKDADGGWQTRNNGGWQDAPSVPSSNPYADRGANRNNTNTAGTGGNAAANRPTPPADRPAPGANRPSPPTVGTADRPNPGMNEGNRPATRPSEPVNRPGQPTTRPSQPTTRPSQPVSRPSQPVSRPSQPTTRPAQGGSGGGGYSNRQSTPVQLNRDAYSRQRSGGGGMGGGGGGRRR
jgi:hypothetical protein